MKTSRSFRRRVSCLGIAIVAAVSLLVVAAPARAERYADGAVEVIELPQMVPTNSGTVNLWQGYIEMPYAVRNLSRESHMVELMTEQSPVVRRRVRLEPGQDMRVSLLLPVPYLGYSEEVVVRVDGRRQDRPISSHGNYRSIERGRTVLMSQGTMKLWGRGSHKTPQTAEMPCRQWSTNYLAYTCFNVVAVTMQEQSEMPAGVLRALRRYAESGGQLVVYRRQGEGGDEKAVLHKILSQDAEAGADGRRLVGLGQIIVRESRIDPVSTIGETALLRDNENYLLRGSPVPARGLMTVVVVFALLLGPVNLIFLSKRRRRVWIWWTVPAISLVAVIVIFSYAMLSEGVTGRTRCMALTVLDENAGRASSVALLSYYCPLAPGALQFSYDSEVMPLGFPDHDHSYSYGHSSTRSAAIGTIDLSKCQEFSGWLPARTARGFRIRKNEDRRERLPIHRTADGKPAVVNGLGVDIISLTFTDTDGRSYAGHDIVAGKEQTLTPLAAAGVNRIALPHELAAQWPHSLDLDLRYTVPPPGRYLAVVERTPFIEQPLSRVREEDSRSLIYGISKQEAE